MSSSTDKRFGDLFIFGTYKDGYVDLVFSSHSEEFTIQHISSEDAQNLRRVWQENRDEMHRLVALQNEVAKSTN